VGLGGKEMGKSIGNLKPIDCIDEISNMQFGIGKYGFYCDGNIVKRHTLWVKA